VLAANRIAQVLNPGFVPGRNLLRHVFLDPEGRQYYLDWEEIAEGAVAGLRASAGAAPDDPRLTGLVGELSVKSEDFRQMWARHDVRARISGRKRYNNPFIGLITLDYETFTVNADPGQTMFVFRAEPGSSDEHSLLPLAEIAAGSQPQRLLRAYDELAALGVRTRLRAAAAAGYASRRRTPPCPGYDAPHRPPREGRPAPEVA
jgi:hypothetical protein